MRQHPQFENAVCQAIAGLVALFSGNQLLNRVVSDRGRAIGGLAVLYLHSTVDADGAAGLTVRRFQTLCVSCGLCSSGRARALLVLMRVAGYIVPAEDPKSRSEGLLIPTERLFEAHRRRWRCLFEAMAPVEPQGRRALVLLDQKAFTSALARHLGAIWIEGFRLLHYAPELTRVAEMNAGLLVTGTLYLAVGPQRAAQATAVPMSISAVAKQFGVARAHVRNILAEAEAARLVQRRAGSTTVIVQLSLHDAMEIFVAALFAALAHCARKAQSETIGAYDEAT